MQSRAVNRRIADERRSGDAASRLAYVSGDHVARRMALALILAFALNSGWLAQAGGADTGGTVVAVFTAVDCSIGCSFHIAQGLNQTPSTVAPEMSVVEGGVHLII